MTYAKTIKCRRCAGTGFVFTDRICFGCNGAGEVVCDKFLRVIGTSGKFFGVSCVINSKTIKEISRAATSDKLALSLESGATFAEITEEQARKFFARYGVRTEIQL